MKEQIKTPKGIKIIAGLMFVCGLSVIPWLRFSLANIIISILSIIASIGLWRVKRWGLFVSYFVLIGVISITTIGGIRCVILKQLPGIVTDNYLPWVIGDFGPPLFIAISILYCLWRNRRCFS